MDTETAQKTAPRLRIVGFRVTDEDVKTLDEQVAVFGANKSDIMRSALKEFFQRRAQQSGNTEFCGFVVLTNKHV